MAVKVIPDQCIGCGACVDVCPFGAIIMQDGKAFSFRFKKQYGLVTACNTGNSLAYKLGKEFEEHLKPQ